MKKDLYTIKLSAGLGLIEETKTLFSLWHVGMKSNELYQAALNSGSFPKISARRLRNIVSECFSPRYLIKGDYPAYILKSILNKVS